MGSLRHIVVFTLYDSADPDDVVVRLRSLEGSAGVLEWRVERSLDERKGVVIVQNSLFASAEELDAFRVAPAHVEVAEFLSRNADWLVADYLE